MSVRRVALIFDHKARPETTGVYCRRALGGLVEVEHFLPAELGRVPRRGFDLYLNIDDGLTYRLPPWMRPCAWWAIDTHLNFDWCREKGADFDFVFAAQRDGAARLREEGVASARWLPLACDPEIHRRHDEPKRYDVAFVGNLFPGPRAELVELIQSRYENVFVGRRYFEEMARVYSASRLVFNRSLKNDINMRVFEAMACGSLVLTNDLADNGQDELFVTGTHLATYQGADDLLGKIDHYLKNPEERERIGAIGRQEVLANHTYRRRMEDLLRLVEGGLAPSRSAHPAVAVADLGSGSQDPSYFEHARPEVLAMVPTSARSVLDVGCGAGRLGEALKARQGCEVVGIEYDPRAAERARGRLDRVIVGDADRLEPDFLPEQFDAVVCGDVLEHLREPDRFLRRVRRWLRPGGALVASLPNVRHRSVVGSLLSGNWTYESAGLLDQTHLRFFTRREIEKLLYRAGFAVTGMRFVPGPGDGEWFEGGRPGTADLGRLKLTGIAPGEAEEFHAYQYLVAATPDEVPERGLTSVVILTHNQLMYTRLCVEGLMRLTDEPYELIFVDNASTDGTVEYLRTVPGARVIVNPENRGFPAAANQGLAVAGGQYLLLLNNDTVVTTGWLGRMLRAFDRDPGVGLVGPCTNRISGPQQVPAGYEELGDLDGFAWDWGKAYDGVAEEIDRLVGFCLLLRREVWEAVGGLDERFGVGCFEDDDYCRRARGAGWRAVIARDAYIHHFGSRTFFGSGADFAGILHENERRYREKWGDAAPALGPGPELEPGPGPAPEPTDGAARGQPAGPAAGHGGPAAPQVPATPDLPPGSSGRAGPYTLEVAPGGGLRLRLGLGPSKVTLSVCMIVRDNAATLPPALESIRPWVDEMVVVDTGSTDATPEIAASLGARVFHFPWCDDFAAARNESLRHARGDWLFWMDSDDTIPEDCGRKLRALAERPADPSLMGYVMQVHCPGGGPDGGHDVTVVDHVKLIRNRPDLRFENRIHEQILPSIRRAGGDVAWTDVYVTHSGSDPGPEAQRRKRERDLRLLHLEDRDRPGHTFTLFNLGMTHADGGEHDEAIGYLERSIARAAPEESHLRKAYALLVYCLAQRGRREEAMAACGRGLGLFPGDVELRFRKGVLLHDLGRLDESAATYEDLLAHPGDRHFASIDRGITGFKARQNLAVAYAEMGDPARAEGQWRRITEEEPGYRAGWRGLADALLRQGRSGEALGVSQRLPGDPAMAAEALLIRGRVAAARGEVAPAAEALRAAAEAMPDDPEPLRVLCQLLFEHGTPDQAAAALEDLARRQPDDPAVRHNLGSVRLRAGRPAEAVEALRESLRLRPDSAQTLVQLGRALKALDRNDEAADAWREALRIDPDHRDARDELRGVEALSAVS